MPIPLGILAVAGAGGGGAAGDYVRLESTILTTNTASVTFSNLNTYSNYKHLQLRLVVRSADTSNNLFLRFNSDTGNNYRTHHLYGNGSSVASFDNGTGSWVFVWDFTDSSQTANIFSPAIIDVLDFSSTNKNKTTRTFGGRLDASTAVHLSSGLWLNTAALTSIQVLKSTGNFLTGSRFSLYGVR